MTEWLPYPQNKPQDTLEDKAKEYVALVPNPRRIKKSGFSSRAPKYVVYLATWFGDGFVDENIRPLNVHYYLVLPSHS